MRSEVLEIPSHRFGRYRVRSRLGSGGMAEVFVADVVDARGEERSVALKLMRPEASREAFAAEADLMGLLQHPNLVERLEVGEAFGRPFIAMEYLLGGDLAHLVEALRRERDPFPPRMAFHVTLEVLKALAHFHQLRSLAGRPLQLVHGDVTPANVLFAADGGVKLGDFGVAKSRLVGVGPDDEVAAGKLHYLSPEQTRGEALDAGSDLFSLGVVLHELLLGVHPFHPGEGSADDVMAAMRAARLQLPASMDKALATLLKKALHPDARSRFRTAGEFGGTLTQYMLEHGLYPSPSEVQGWLGGVLGLVL